MTQAPNDGIRQDLTWYTLRGSWKDVVTIYKNHPWTHTEKINPHEDTALHIAADTGEEEFVKQLLDAIPDRQNQDDHDNERDQETNEEGREVRSKALEAKNKKGDTPLHLAASRGFAKSCNRIARKDSELLKIRNKKGETPLFLAALNWNRDAFLLLYFRYYDDDDGVQLTDFRRDDGDTIMHLAIKWEFFDLAIILTQLRGGALVGDVNKEGKTCFDLLATKPLAFESGRSLGWWKEILYRCIHVPKLEIQIENWKEEINRNYPNREIEPAEEEEKNRKCGNIATSIWRKSVALFGFGGRKHATTDTESPAISELKNDPKANMQGSRKNHACIQALRYCGQEFIRIKKMKETHVWVAQNLDEYVKHYIAGKQPLKKDACEESTSNEVDNNQKTQNESKEVNTPFLVAGEHGIMEIVEKMLKCLPTSVRDETKKEQKNILLVAVENRQPKIIERLKQEKLWDNLVLGKDTKDNTILHLAAMASTYRPWRIPGSALQMLWEIKWYQYAKGLGPKQLPFQTNENGKMPEEVFTEKHEDLVKESSDWLKDTSNSCSVVAALIAGVSFATSKSIPGGTNDQGKAALEGHPAFTLFTVSSLASLCFSITALIMFLSILTSRKQAKDFHKDLPIKLLLGLSSLFLAIASTLVAFCSSNFFVLEDKFKNILFPIYGAICLPASFYAIAQFSLYVDLIVAIFSSTPQGKNWREDHL